MLEKWEEYIQIFTHCGCISALYHSHLQIQLGTTGPS